MATLATLANDSDITAWCRETAAKLFCCQSPGAEAERSTLSHEAGANGTLVALGPLRCMRPRLGDKESSSPRALVMLRIYPRLNIQASGPVSAPPTPQPWTGGEAYSRMHPYTPANAESLG